MHRYHIIIKAGITVFLFLLLSAFQTLAAESRENSNIKDDGAKIVKKAFDYYRGSASIAVVEMTVHRREWERKMKIKAWTRGEHDSLFKIIAPPKDRGNGTLKKGDAMWTYNPKINRTIKLPPSMMSQGWMGSDFSNNDLAKSDTIVSDYSHSITGISKNKGMKIYKIQSIPHPQAPVVWGMLTFTIRQDGIMLSQGFYDEDKLLVKELVTTGIKMMGSKLFPCVWKIYKTENSDEYTTLEYFELEFKEFLPSGIFTRTGLKKRIRE